MKFLSNFHFKVIFMITYTLTRTWQPFNRGAWRHQQQQRVYPTTLRGVRPLQAIAMPITVSSLRSEWQHLQWIYRWNSIRIFHLAPHRSACASIYALFLHFLLCRAHLRVNGYLHEWWLHSASLLDYINHLTFMSFVLSCLLGCNNYFTEFASLLDRRFH